MGTHVSHVKRNDPCDPAKIPTTAPVIEAALVRTVWVFVVRIVAQLSAGVHLAEFLGFSPALSSCLARLRPIFAQLLLHLLLSKFSLLQLLGVIFQLHCIKLQDQY